VHMKWGQRIMYVASSTVMSVTEVTKEKPGMGAGEGSGSWYSHHGGEYRGSSKN